MASTSSSADGTVDSTDGPSSLSRRERFERYAEPARYRNVVDKVALQRPRDFRARDGYLQMQDIDAPASPNLIRVPQIRTSRTTSSSSSATKYRSLAEFRSQDKDRKARINELYETLRQQSPGTQGATAPVALKSSPERQSAEEQRKAAVRKAYLKELYERINSDDGDRQGQSSSSGPSLDRLMRFVEQREEALWQLFCAIDSNDDMLLSQDELLHSLHKAGKL